jgi:PBP1b-binding outer membrane lipoprotein LpoB
VTRLLTTATIAAAALLLAGCASSAPQTDTQPPAVTSSVSATPTQTSQASASPSATPLPSTDELLKKAFEFAPYTLVDAAGNQVTSINSASEAHLDYDKSLGDFSTHYCFNLESSEGKFTLTQQYNSAWAEYDGKPAGRIYSIAPGICH